MAKTISVIETIGKLPKLFQRFLLGMGWVQRSQTYIAKMPNMLPMLNNHKQQSPQLKKELEGLGIAGAESIFINMEGVILHALYYPPKNNKIICAFHGIKGNWLNNPAPATRQPEDSDYNEKYRMLMLAEFAAEGFGFFAFSMPGFEPSFGVASEKNFIKACEHFAAHIKNYAIKNGFKSEDIIVCGESLGGAVAAIFATKMTEISYPPALLSLITTFDSLVAMTANRFPVFTNAELEKILCDKLDTTKELAKLNKQKTYIHIVSVEEDLVIPLQNTINLRDSARSLGFNVLYQQLSGHHTTWDKKTVIASKELVYMARQKGIKIESNFSVDEIKEMLK